MVAQRSVDPVENFCHLREDIMTLWLSIFLIWLLASLPFALVLARIIRHGSDNDE